MNSQRNKKNNNIPIILLTAKGEVENRIKRIRIRLMTILENHLSQKNYC